MFFDQWQGIYRVLIVGFLAYLFLVFWLRISGKRTLSKWNAFDFIVTIALGSTLATVLLTKNVALVEGCIAFVVLITLQYVTTWLCVHTGIIERLVKAKPTLLFYKGQFRIEAMKSQRVTQSEILAAIRGAGLADTEAVLAVVLETDGNFSVIKRSDSNSMSALEDIVKA